MEDKRFTLVKPIMTSEGEIKAGTDIYLIHGVFFMDGGMLDKSYQEDFRMLLNHEINNGWNYLRPIQ